MQVESTRHRAGEVMSDWQTDLKEVDRKRRTTCSQFCRKGQPILIDYGSDTIKAGFGCSIQPEMVFKSLTSKAKESLAASFTNTINFSYEQLDFLKSNYRSPFDRNIIQHFSALEHCNDFVFSSLGCTEDSVRSPLVVSETPANPIYCRSQLLEMLFECYGVPEVFVGCDGLFAYFHELDCELKDMARDTRLIVSFGASATHVIPVINGKVDYNAIKRINLGANNCLEVMGKLVTLKNPELKQQLTYPVIKHLFNKFACVAADYHEQLLYFKSEGEPEIRSGYKNRVVEENSKFGKARLINEVQIEFDRPGFDISPDEIRRREEIKKRMAERLKQALQRKREEKQRIFRSEYDELVKIKQKYDADPENNKEELTETFGEDKPEILLKRRIRFLEVKLEIESKDEQKKFALIDIPDNELPPDKQRLKKLQIYQKAALQQRRKKKEQELEQQRQMRQLRQQNPEKYLEELRTKYNALHTRMKENERIKSELSNRNSRLNQRRMQTLAQLAEENEDDDNFGENEDDWMLYRAYEQEDHRSEMEALEVELREIDPSWMVDTDRHHLNTGFTLHLASELIRPCQAYFQPYMIGNDQMSLPDIIALVVSRYSVEVRNTLLQRILLVSGACKINGLRERLISEVTSRSQAGTKIDIKVARQPQQGCFLGMRGLAAKYPDYIKQHSIKRTEWLQGGLPAREHLFARLHF